MGSSKSCVTPTYQTHPEGAQVFRSGPRFTPIQHDWHNVGLIETDFSIQSNA